jgi:DNA-binding MarR family transcriptional regulator
MKRKIIKKKNPSFFEVKTPEASLGFLLWQVTTLWQREIKSALKEYDTSHAQFVVLANLLWFEEKNMSSTQADIVSQSKIDKMSVSASLKELVKMGLVTRKENEEDSRFKSVNLTNKGREHARTLVALIESCDRDYFNKLSKEEKKQFSKVLLSLIS